MNTLRNLLVAFVAMVMAFTFSIVGMADAGYSIPGRTTCQSTEYLGSRICVDYSLGKVYIFNTATSLLMTGDIQSHVTFPIPVGFVAADTECVKYGQYNAKPMVWIQVPTNIHSSGWITLRYTPSAPQNNWAPFNDILVTPPRFGLAPYIMEYLAAFADAAGFECVVVP
jgi:hypothetical protein